MKGQILDKIVEKFGFLMAFLDKKNLTVLEKFIERGLYPTYINLHFTIDSETGVQNRFITIKLYLTETNDVLVSYNKIFYNKLLKEQNLKFVKLTVYRPKYETLFSSNG